MHTLIVIAGGLVALTVFVIAAVLMRRPPAAGARLFVLPWLAAALFKSLSRHAARLLRRERASLLRHRVRDTRARRPYRHAVGEVSRISTVSSVAAHSIKVGDRAR